MGGILNTLYLVILYIVILNAIPVEKSYLSKLREDTRLLKFNTTLTNPDEINFLNGICNAKLEDDHTNYLLCNAYYEMLINLSYTKFNSTPFDVKSILSDKINEKSFCNDKKFPEIFLSTETNATIELSKHFKNGKCEIFCNVLKQNGFEIKPICRLLFWGYALPQNLTALVHGSEHNNVATSQIKKDILPQSLDAVGKKNIIKTDKAIDGTNLSDISNLTPHSEKTPIIIFDDTKKNKKSENEDDKIKDTVSGATIEVNTTVTNRIDKNEPQELKPTSLPSIVSTAKLPAISEQGPLPVYDPPSNTDVVKIKDSKPQSESNTAAENDINSLPVQDIFEPSKVSDTTNNDEEDNMEIGDINPNKNDDQSDDVEENEDMDSAEENTQSPAFNIDKINNLKEIESFLPSSKNQDHIVEDPFFEENDSNFFSYFMFIMVVCIISYVIYHNKTKMLALMLEGRRGVANRATNGGSRRKHTAAYRKLDSNLEEAITSSGANSRSAQIIY